MLNSLIESLESLQKLALIIIKFFLVIFIVIAFLETILLIASAGSGNGLKPRQEQIARNIQQALNSSAAIYVAMQRTPPKSFKDYVQQEGATSGTKTLTLENIIKELEDANPPTIRNPLVLKFNEGGTATYYLNATDVTATYEGF